MSAKMLRYGVLSFVISVFPALGAHAGVTFSSPAPLNSNAATDSAYDFTPRIATDHDDTFVVVWASQDTLGNTVGSDKDIFFSRSTNDGATWSAVATINDDAASDSSIDEQPDIATDGTTWIAVWASDRNAGSGDGVDSDIFFSRSTNGGASWSNAAVLNTNATSDFADDEQPPRIFTDGQGTWICAWGSEEQLGDLQFDLDVVFSRSTDSGQTWSAPAYLNSNSVNSTGYDVRPYLAVSDAGTWVAVWESNDDLSKGTSSDSDLLFARSTDGGQTWSDADFLNSDAATDQGQSPIGNEGRASVASLGGTDWLAMWHRYLADGAAEILYVRSMDDGVTWSDPVVFDSPDKYSKGPGKSLLDITFIIFLALPPPHKGDIPLTPLILAVGVGDVSVSNPGAGPPVSGVDYDLRTYIGDLSGTKWTRPELANPNAFSDSGDDSEPVLARDNSGHVVLVWSSTDKLNNTIGFDSDILVSTATVGGLAELITPNGGEKWKRGKKKKIEWVTNVDAAEDVQLNLLRNGNKVTTIKNSTANDGKLKWKVPNGLSKGGGYQVKIELKSDSNVSDESYYDFKVK